MKQRFVLRFILFCALLPFALEIGVRFFIPQQLVRFDNVYQPDDELGMVPKPNLDMIINTGERDARYVTDDHGYRVSGNAPVNTAAIRILELGDSFVAAFQVDYDQTFGALLEQKLSAELDQPVEIVNTGSANYDINHYEILARRELARQHYDMVLVSVNVGNDFVTTRVRSFPAQKPTVHKFQIPNNFSKQQIMSNILYPLNDLLDSHSHLFVLLKNREEILLTHFGLTSLHFPRSLLRIAANDPMWLISADVIGDIQAEANKEHSAVLVVLLPSSDQMDPTNMDWIVNGYGIDPKGVDLDQPSKQFTAAAAKYQIPVVDMLQPFRQAFQQGEQIYGAVDAHLSPIGHRIVADTLAPEMLKSLRNSR